MFLGNSAKKNQQNGIVGLDLCEQYAQVSICPAGSDKTETRFTVTKADIEGELSEEMKNSREDILFLLAKKCLSQPEIAIAVTRAALLMVCLEEITREAVEFLDRLAKEMAIQTEKVVCLNREESFYYYSLRQPEELWENSCMICEFTGQTLRTLILEASRREQPFRAQVQVKEHPELVDFHEPGESLTEGQRRKMDQAFLDILSEVSESRTIDTVYLMGEIFEDDWYEASLQVLCRNRRVFLGDNIYSKGACYGGRIKLENGENKQKVQYISSEKLSVNVGINAFVGGKGVCQPLLEIGTNWYEAENECEFYLNRDFSFSLKVTPEELSAKNAPTQGLPSRTKKEKEVVVTLDGVPDRPDKATRIHLKVYCPRAGVVRLTMEDLGFGEIYPATHKVWEEEFSLGGITG